MLEGRVSDAEVFLSRVSADDAPALFTALDHPEVGTYIGGRVADSPEAMRRLIERWVAGPTSDHGRERWLNYVVRLGDGTTIGHAQATVNPSWAEVAWVIGTPWWGQGFGFETATSLLRELASGFSISTAWATVDPDNVRCVRLLARLGFQEVDVATAPALGSYDPGDLVYTRSLQSSRMVNPAGLRQ